MVIVAMVLVSLWLVGVSSPRDESGLIHLLLMSAVVLLVYKIFGAKARPARDGRWPPWNGAD